MKNLVTIFSLVLFTFAAFANTYPVPELKLIDTENATVTILESDVDVFVAAEYTTDGNFEFETKDEISFIQIFDAEGALEFQLPVMSNKVTLGNGLLETGNYRLGFMVQGSSMIHFTSVAVK